MLHRQLGQVPRAARNVAPGLTMSAKAPDPVMNVRRLMAFSPLSVTVRTVPRGSG
jgi:hypothetical protein